MAEYPTTNINENLIGAGLNTSNPTGTYVDFATQLAKNSMEQKQMEENLARARLMTRQAQVQTAQQEEAQKAGFNPQLIGTMTPEQAVSTVKMIFAQKGTQVPEETIDEWAKQLPPVVQATQVEEFASRFARETNKLSQPFVASKSDAKSEKTDENGDPLVEGQTYSALYNNQGHVESYVRSGQEKAQDNSSLKLSEKDNQFWTNQWKTRVANKINPYLASARTAVGVALQSYIRCFRALETLDKKPVTKQDATNVIMEIGAVYKGGSPDQSAILETSYKTLFGDFNDWLQSWSGKARTSVPDGILNHLISRVQDLEDQSKKVVQDSISTAETLNADVIEHFPDQWEKFMKEIDKTMNDPNGSGVKPVAKVIPNKVVPKYTVEE